MLDSSKYVPTLHEVIRDERAPCTDNSKLQSLHAFLSLADTALEQHCVPPSTGKVSEQKCFTYKPQQNARSKGRPQRKRTATATF